MITRRAPLTGRRFLQGSRHIATTGPNIQRAQFHRDPGARQFLSFFRTRTEDKTENPNELLATLDKQMKLIETELSEDDGRAAERLLTQAKITFGQLESYWAFYMARTLAQASRFDDKRALEQCNAAIVLVPDLQAKNVYNLAFPMMCEVLRVKSERLLNTQIQESLDVRNQLIEMVRNKIEREKNAATLELLIHKNLVLDLYARANIYTSWNILSEAMADIMEAIRLEPNNAEYKALKAEIHFRLSEFNEAEELGEKVLLMDTNFVVRDAALKTLAKSGYATRKYEAALRYIDSITRLDTDIHVLRAECNSALHRYAEVVEDCTKAGTADIPFLPTIVKLHANALSRLARYEELLDYTTRIARLVKVLKLEGDIVLPISRMVLLAEIDKLIWDEKFQPVLELISNELSQVKESVNSELERSLVQRRTNALLSSLDNKSALESAEEYVRLARGHGWTAEVDSLELRALAKARLGNLSEAHEDLALAEELISKSQEPNQYLFEEEICKYKYTKGSVLKEKTEQWTEALKLLGEALEYTKKHKLNDMMFPILVDMTEIEVHTENFEAITHLGKLLDFKPKHRHSQYWWIFKAW